MPLITGNDGSNTLLGSAGQDVIYGFDPNGPQSQVNTIAATRVATGLSQPLFAVAPPGDFDRLFIVEKTGQIKILNLNTGQVLATPFLNVSGQISTSSESGLLGLAFDPNYAQNGFFYVNLINTIGDTEIRRYHVSGDPNVADAASASLVIGIDQPNGLGNHKGGWLAFGPDGHLYTALGDGGGSGDPFGNGQNINTLLGKILRLDVSTDGFPADPTRNYAIPADNPFVGTAGADEIWALGLRNPWRPSFDRALGDFFIADVGQGAWEEVNLGVRGGNYGWDVFEGPDVFDGGTPTGGSAISPIHFYDHSVGRSITGGYVYRGESEGLQGRYFFADFVTNKIFTLHFNGSSWVAVERTSQVIPNIGAINSPSSFGEDGRGNLYVVDLDGDVFRLTPVVASADQGDNLQGLAGDDLLYGGSGNDSLNGGPGNDVIHGGPGVDTAIFAGVRAAYTLTDLGGGSVRVVGPDGTDTLMTVENLRFDDQTVIWTGPPQSTATISRPADFNGDGSDDIVWHNADGRVSIWLLNGGQLASATAIGATATSWQIEGTGDFNGDGRDDILWRNDTGQVASWQLNGTQLASIATLGSAALSWHVQGTGRFNADARDDILWRHDDGRVATWLTDAGGQIASASTIGTAALAWHIAETGDFNGDGVSDILWRNDDGHVAAWLLNGGGQLAAVTDVGSAAKALHIAGTGDFNNDGRDDILWRNDNGQVIAWHLSAGQIASTTSIGSASQSFGIAGTADVNADGTDDILWRNDDGRAVAWLLGGGQLAAATDLGTAPPTWQIGGSHFDLV